MGIRAKLKKQERENRRQPHVKKGDNVKVLSGRDKGKTGRVLKIVSSGQRVIVEKVNFIKRHTKPSQKVQQGGILEKEASLDVSNVILICPRCDKPARQARKRLEDGTGTRICVKCREVIDG